MATKQTNPVGPAFENSGTTTSTIDVRISNRIVELFSEGLYSTPNKAVEELVSNSFDAGAKNVHVIMPPDFSVSSAKIVVVDDGLGMDEAGLKQHWIIGASGKRRKGAKTPLGRQPIGKFGIGKLATYVLANKLTHVSKTNGTYYAVTMDYRKVHSADAEEVFSDAKVQLPLRKMSEAEAKLAVEEWLSVDSKAGKALKLFGEGAAKSWTVAILSDLKGLAAEIRRGQLKWVLQIAMPTREDFHLFLDGQAIKSGKMASKHLHQWVLGKDAKDFEKLDTFVAEEKKRLPDDDPSRFFLRHPTLGEITGHYDVYRDLLTIEKATEERTHGFFVYVRDRLINLTDEYFGIDRNLLRHGTFSRFRMIVHVDGLDDDLRSSRENLREGPQIEATRELLKAAFNNARIWLENYDTSQTSSVRLAARVADSPASLTSQPILGLLRSALEGKASPKYLSIPQITPKEREAFISEVSDRASSAEGLIRNVELIDVGDSSGIANYDTQTGTLQVNLLHPFVAFFLDEFEDPKRNLPLDLLAMSEVLMEASLYQIAGDEDTVRTTMDRRDNLLRYLARSLGKRNAFVVAKDLLDASNNKTKLEVEVVAAFNSLGFDAIPLGGKGRSDGMATAHLSATIEGQPRFYSVSLEAKSKEKEGKTVTAKTVGVSTVALHRTKNKCEHAIVIGPSFPTSQGDAASVNEQIAADAKNTGKTITLMKIVDLARLVRIVPIKRINLESLRELFLKCKTPEESAAFVDKLEKMEVKHPPYKIILEAIWTVQKDAPSEAVQYGAVTSYLRYQKAIDITGAEIATICKAFQRIVPGYVFAETSVVELTQQPDTILKAMGSVINQYGQQAAFGKALELKGA